MRIGIDIDNVITNTVDGVIQYVNARLPIELKKEDIKEYWMEKALPEQYRWIIPLAFEDPKMWKNVEMIEGAAQYIGKLYDDGHEIYFVTATTPINFKKKVGFLERNLPFFPQGYVRDHAISIREKQLLKLDVLIDDYVDNLIGARDYKSVCLDYPWNRYVKSDEKTFFRVYDWAMVYEIITKISRGDFNE